MNFSIQLTFFVNKNSAENKDQKLTLLSDIDFIMVQVCHLLLAALAVQRMYLQPESQALAVPWLTFVTMLVVDMRIWRNSWFPLFRAAKPSADTSSRRWHGNRSIQIALGYAFAAAVAGLLCCAPEALLVFGFLQVSIRVALNAMSHFAARRNDQEQAPADLWPVFLVSIFPLS